jgi:hypothetical protein
MKDISLDHSDLSNPNHLNFNDVDFIEDKLITFKKTKKGKETITLSRKHKMIYDRMKAGYDAFSDDELDNTSLRELREYVQVMLSQGQKFICPLSGRRIAEDYRHLTKSHLLWLRELWELSNHGQTPVNYNNIKSPLWNENNANASDYTILKFWGFIMKIKAGIFIITPKGIAFMNNLLSVPSYFKIRNNKIVGESKDLVRAYDLTNFSLDSTVGKENANRLRALNKH